MEPGGRRDRMARRAREELAEMAEEYAETHDLD